MISRDAAAPPAIRRPAVAGRFYPADPGRLAETVDGLLAAARRQPAGAGLGPVRAVVVPHAGYQYSGPVAAAAYALLSPRPPRRVVLLGPAHYVPVAGCAVPRAEAWGTPLGLVPIDPALREAALTCPGVRADDRPHAPEHALEVQLPFLQRVLGPRPAPPAPPVLPVATHAPAREVADLLDAVVTDPESTDGAATEAGTLVLVSTDLSHYRPDPVARDLDARTAEAITGLRPDRIADRAACGAHALRGLLAWAAGHQLSPHQLALGTSADAGGDPSRVVGYTAFAFT